MIKTREFFSGGVKQMDEKINSFLKEGNHRLIDVKLIGVNNTYTT